MHMVTEYVTDRNTRWQYLPDSFYKKRDML